MILAQAIVCLCVGCVVGLTSMYIMEELLRRKK